MKRYYKFEFEAMDKAPYEDPIPKDQMEDLKQELIKAVDDFGLRTEVKDIKVTESNR